MYLYNVEHVLINVGTGYYVEKIAEDAKGLLKKETDFLPKQMEKTQPALQEKHAIKQAVTEMMMSKKTPNSHQLTALSHADSSCLSCHLSQADPYNK
uniref:Prefoldin subunit 5 n=1 Tax=Canis lupus dingo TaxID=286419 RepID=A0A8C0R7N4_CANLU